MKYLMIWSIVYDNCCVNCWFWKWIFLHTCFSFFSLTFLITIRLSPFSNFGSTTSPLTGLYPLSLSSLSNSIAPNSAVSAAAAAIPYSQYLSSLASYSGLTPISPLGPWGGINPYYNYLNLADYPDYRSYPTLQNYLQLPTYTPPIYTAPPFPGKVNHAKN